MTFTLRGIHVFWMVFAFFAAITAVDAFFIVRAVGSFPGEIVPNSYVQGLDFNRTLERSARQRQLGWIAAAGFEGSDTFVVRFQKEPGVPLTGLDATVALHVPGDSNEAQPLQLIERAPGEYVAKVVIRGHRIEAEITARRAGEGEAVFQAEKTLVLP